MTIPSLAKLIGILLVALGIGGFLATGATSITALIPGLFGILLFTLGYAARTETLRKHLMHTASIVALIGFVATLARLLMTGGEIVRPFAAASQSVMAILCLVFLLFAVRSFVRARSQGASPTDHGD